MKLIEIILLIITYTVLVLTIFVSFICYKRKLEKWETIVFSMSLLCLILSITIVSLSKNEQSTDATNIFVLLSMILVGLTTLLNVLSERQHKISDFYRKSLVVISIMLFLSTCLAYFFDKLNYVELIVTIFLGVSIVSSMLLIRNTKPQKSIAHLEKVNRIFAIIFILIVPISLFANYTLTNMGYQLTIGLTIPLVFIILSTHKLLDDLRRLSLINTKIEPNLQHFENYHISEREKEIATLLIEGKTYKQISEQLFISISTVKSHTSKIYKKCGVKNRNELSHLLSN